MEEAKNRFYSLMVVGEHPDELLKKYDSNVEVEAYVKYFYKDAGKLKKKAIELTQQMIAAADKVGLSDVMVDYLKERVGNLKSLSDFEYYTSITSDLIYDKDGNALSTANPNGKYTTCRVGKNLCIPLTLKDGSEVFSAQVKDIDWDKMHMTRIDIYKLAWELFHEEKEPETEQEKLIYSNVKGQVKYFSGFDNVDEYVSYNCSYWNYAYLDCNGWYDAIDHNNYKWIVGFYDRFVLPLNDEDYVTIYECQK